MKVLKKATQRNIILNKNYYTIWEIKEMLINKECCYFTEASHKESYDFEKYCYKQDRLLRIFTEDINEIKVVYNKEFGNYETVAIGKNCKTYHVEL